VIFEYFKNLKPANKKEKNCVYCALNKKNNKIYIGYTETSLYRRISSHYYCSRNNFSNNFFKNALSKYDKKDFEWYILFISNDLKELKNKEMEFIKKFKSNNKKYGYNSSSGGEENKLNLESRKKISNKAKQRDIKGSNNPFFGKTHTEETKKHLSKIRKGICYNPNYKHTEETKLKLSNIRKKLCKNPDHILKMRLVQKSKKIKCINNNTEYNSIGEAARQLNLKKNSIQAQLKGRIKKLKGYEFIFVDFLKSPC
jgi:group I intron endonuclease